MFYISYLTIKKDRLLLEFMYVAHVSVACVSVTFMCI